MQKPSSCQNTLGLCGWINMIDHIDHTHPPSLEESAAGIRQGMSRREEKGWRRTDGKVMATEMEMGEAGPGPKRICWETRCWIYFFLSVNSFLFLFLSFVFSSIPFFRFLRRPSRPSPNDPLRFLLLVSLGGSREEARCVPK